MCGRLEYRISARAFSASLIMNQAFRHGVVLHGAFPFQKPRAVILLVFAALWSPVTTSRSRGRSWRQERGRRDSGQFRARAEQNAARWTVARHALDRSQGSRAAVPDQRQPQDPADLRHRRRRTGARAGGRNRFDRAGLSDGKPGPGSPGKYWVQAVLHKYETFHRADGHTVKLPMDRGEGQQWNKAPGNLYSTPREVTIDPGPKQRDDLASGSTRSSRRFPTRRPRKYIKHERIQSERLTKFWGRPMHLGAHVLLPEGFDSHPEAHYPLVIFHGHFPPDLRRLPRGATRPQPQARVQRPVSSCRLQPHRSRNSPTSSTRTGPGQTIHA